MSTQDIRGLREQILANGRFILRSTEASANSRCTSSSSTLVAPTDSVHVIVFGEGMHMRGALMLGLLPAIEGGEAGTAESALRKLLIAVTETTSLYIPKIGDHMRNIHGGGIFDEDLIAPELKDCQKKTG